MAQIIRGTSVRAGRRRAEDRSVRTMSPAAPAGASSRPQARPGDAAQGRTLRRRVGAYVALTKPRVIELLLVTTLPTMILAHGGFPSVGLVLATLVGGAAAAGSANVL